jgi:hypothetical protein
MGGKLRGRSQTGGNEEIEMAHGVLQEVAVVLLAGATAFNRHCLSQSIWPAHQGRSL